MKIWSIIFALASCGRVGFDDVTGAGADDANPSSDGSVPPTMVRVTTRIDGTVTPGVTVLFHDAQGNLLVQTTSDANGQAMMELPPGGSVSELVRFRIAATATDTDTVISTIVGAMPGDDLILDTVNHRGQTDLMGVTMPAFTGADHYAFGLPCTETPAPTPTNSAYYRPGCVGAPTFDLIAIALDVNERALAWAMISGIAVGTPSISGPAWSTSFTPVQASTSAVPLWAVGFGVDASPFVGGRLRRDARFRDGVAATPGAPANVALGVPATISSEWLYCMLVVDSLGAPSSIVQECIRSGTTSNIAIAGYLPPIVNASLAVGGMGRLTINATAIDATGADAMLAFLSWEGASRQFANWVAVIPPDATLPIRLPDLPTSLGSFVPPTALRGSSLVVVEGPVLADYREARQVLFTREVAELLTSAGAYVRLSQARL